MTAALKSADLHLPIPGFYKMGLVRRGIDVPVFVDVQGDRCPETGELMEDERVIVIVNGHEKGWDSIDYWNEKINMFAKRISEPEYRYMLDVAEWARDFCPGDLAARPRESLSPAEYKWRRENDEWSAPFVPPEPPAPIEAVDLRKIPAVLP